MPLKFIMTFGKVVPGRNVGVVLREARLFVNVFLPDKRVDLMLRTEQQER